MALYRVRDATVIHRFPANRGITDIALTTDETLFLIACDDGTLSLWEVESGKRLWQQSRSQSGLRVIFDSTFALNDESCIVACDQGQAIILKTSSGERLGVIRFPPNETSVMSAALSRNNTSGFLIDLGERLHTFDTANGRLNDTGLTGAWPVRYCADGSYIAFRSKNSGISEQLRVVAARENLASQDLGQFSGIARIKQAREGRFLI